MFFYIGLIALIYVILVGILTQVERLSYVEVSRVWRVRLFVIFLICSLVQIGIYIYNHTKVISLEGKLEEKTSSIKRDPFVGAEGLGWEYIHGSELSHQIGKAREYIREKRFDLALVEADNIEKRYPGLTHLYIRYLVYKEKGDSDKATKYALKIIDGDFHLSYQRNEGELIDLYKYVIDYFLVRNKDKARHFVEDAMARYPNDESLRQLFMQHFGHTP